MMMMVVVMVGMRMGVNVVRRRTEGRMVQVGRGSVSMMGFQERFRFNLWW